MPIDYSLMGKRVKKRGYEHEGVIGKISVLDSNWVYVIWDTGSIKIAKPKICNIKELEILKD